MRKSTLLIILLFLSCIILSGCSFNGKEIIEDLQSGINRYSFRINSLRKTDYSDVFFDDIQEKSDSASQPIPELTEDDSEVQIITEDGEITPEIQIIDAFDSDEYDKEAVSDPITGDSEIIQDTYSSSEASRSSESMYDKYLADFYRLAPTTGMSFAELVGDNGLYSYPEGFPEPGTYRITVDLKYQVVMAFSADAEGNYTVPVRYMLCSTGASKSPTPTGIFTMPSYRVRFALFNNTDVYGQYWSQITGRIYFHSILYSSADASAYTESSYNNLGKRVSHGCIRLSVPDARWIWYNVAPGSVVEIRNGSSDDKETASIRNMLKLAVLPSERVIIDKNNLPYTDNWRIDDVSHDVDFIQGVQ